MKLKSLSLPGSLVLLLSLNLTILVVDTQRCFADLKSCDCPYAEASAGPGLKLRLLLAQTPNHENQNDDSVSQKSGEYKSESAAFKASLWGTLLPLPTIVLTIPGLIGGPSIGYFTSGLKSRAWMGIGIRTVGVGGAISAFAICGWDCGPNCDWWRCCLPTANRCSTLRI